MTPLRYGPRNACTWALCWLCCSGCGGDDDARLTDLGASTLVDELNEGERAALCEAILELEDADELLARIDCTLEAFIEGIPADQCQAFVASCIDAALAPGGKLCVVGFPLDCPVRLGDYERCIVDNRRPFAEHASSLQCQELTLDNAEAMFEAAFSGYERAEACERIDACEDPGFTITLNLPPSLYEVEPEPEPEPEPPPDDAECNAEVSQRAAPACAACLCAIAPGPAYACDATCFELLDCVRELCDNDYSDAPCVTSACVRFLGGATAATEVGTAAVACADDCAATNETDGGAP